MPKRHIYIFLIGFLLTAILFLSYQTKTYSQITPQPTVSRGGTPAAKPQAWVCLQSKPYSGPIRPDGRQGQRVSVTGSGLPEDKCVYIVGCIDTPDNIECTTGSDDLDQELGLGIGNATKMRTSNNSPKPYQFVVDGGSKKCNLQGGNLNLIARTVTRNETNHSVFAVYFTDVDQSTNQDSGTAQTLKYGSFSFKGGPGACQGVRWDPWGVAFDSKSLEPLPAVSITLRNSLEERVILPGLPNPVTTKQDGLYNFLPEEGDYSLGIIRSGYNLVAAGNIHPNFIKAYSDLYQHGSIIKERQGKAEHRDVALDPGANSPYRADPVHMHYGISQDGKSHKIGGKQSHPLTKVEIYQDGQPLSQTAADKYGFYEVMVANSLIKPDLPVEVYFTKVDLTADEFTPAAEAKKAYQSSPIPPYLEGTAYNAQKKAMPGATVKIKLDMSDQIFAETQTDNAGNFIFTPSKLPPFSYHLEFTPKGSLTTIKKTINEFASENKDYLTANNINIMTATKQGKPLIIGSQPQVSPSVTQQPKPLSDNPLRDLIITAILLVLFITTLVVSLKLKKNKKASSPEEKNDSGEINLSP